MTTTYTATLHYEIGDRSPGYIDHLMGELDGFHPAIGSTQSGYLDVTITFDSEDARAAYKTAFDVITHAVNSHGMNRYGAGAMPNYVEVMTTAEWDAREGFDQVPALMSVSEIAAEYDRSRQAVLKMIERGWFQSAQRVGETWAVARTEVLLKKPRTADEAAAAIAKGSQQS